MRIFFRIINELFIGEVRRSLWYITFPNSVWTLNTFYGHIGLGSGPISL